MDGKIIRMNSIINPTIRRSLIVNMSSLLERFYDEKEFLIFRKYCDGIILKQSHVERLYHLFLGRNAPALILRYEWKKILDSNLSQIIEEALSMNVSAIISSFFVGYERDEEEAENLKAISLLARESEWLNLPLIIECIPFGERITKENFGRCVELAARVAAEAGGDIIAMPHVRDVFTLQKIITGVDIPIFISDAVTPFGAFPIKDIKILLDSGVSGFLISEKILQEYGQEYELEKIIRIFHDSIHGGFVS